MKISACDLCKRPEGPQRTVYTFFIVTGRGTDAAGSIDDEGDNVDLCGYCMMNLFCNILKERDYERNKKILGRIRKR